MQQLKLLDGTFALISDEDADLLSWPAFSLIGEYPVRRKTGGDGKKYVIFLHRIIATRMGLSESLLIDHKDANKRNAQRENLRSATSGQNQINRPPRKDNSSNTTGVTFNARSRKWVARLSVDGYRRCLGSFASKDEAISRRKEAEKFYYGSFAFTGETNGTP